jgi:hypothetical protein
MRHCASGKRGHTTDPFNFITPALIGTQTIYTKPNMILLIGVTNGTAPFSFLYFNVDATVATQETNNGAPPQNRQ